MKRTILALATAGLSFSAYALPPPGGGPPGPLDVNVTNVVLPVEVSNADPIPVSVATSVPNVICGMRTLGSASGAPSIKGGDGYLPIPSTICPEMVVEYVLLDPNETWGVDGYFATLKLGPPGGESEVLLGVLTFGQPIIRLPMPVHFTPGMRLTYKIQCTPAPAATTMTCDLGFRFVGRQVP